jgi:hypothetical protein
MFDTFARFGAPSCLVSDRGANFLSKMVAALCELFSVKRVHTSSYHPQTNASVERFNAVIGQGLRTYLDEHQENWSSFLPGILMAYRATPATQSTKYSPYFMVFGREMVLPLDVALQPKESLGKNVQQHLNEILHNLEETQKIATENLQKARAKSKEYYDKQARKPSFAPGDQVLVYNPHVPKGKASKLWKMWTGPYYITQIGPNHTYKLRLCADNSELKVLIHANRLKPYFGREQRPQPQPTTAAAPAPAAVTGQATQAPTQPPQTQNVLNDPMQGLPTAPNGPGQWHSIDKIIACKRQGKQIIYKVRWSSGNKTEWVNGDDITDEAKREFHVTKTASGKSRKRPLQRHKFFKS